MPGERSRRTLAERERPGERTELDCGRGIIPGIPGGRTCSARAWKMGARELAAGRRVLSVDDGGGCGLVANSQTALRHNAFSQNFAPFRAWPGLVALPTAGRDGEGFAPSHRLTLVEP